MSALTLEEYYAAVLLVAGPPPLPYPYPVDYDGLLHYKRTIDTLCQLVPMGPAVSINYADFVNWYRSKNNGNG